MARTGHVSKGMIERCLQSNGLGKNNMKFLSSDGIVHIDAEQVIRQKYKYDSYKLDNVCKQLIF